MIKPGLLLLVFAISAVNAEDFRFSGGKAEDGKTVFQNLNCIQCHSIPGNELEKSKTKPRVNVSLATGDRFVKNYEDIIVAITNPQHVVTEQYKDLLNQAEINGEITALMPSLIHDMSVQQFMDLVAFLDRAYQANSGNYQSNEQ